MIFKLARGDDDDNNGNRVFTSLAVKDKWHIN